MTQHDQKNRQTFGAVNVVQPWFAAHVLGVATGCIDASADEESTTQQEQTYQYRKTKVKAVVRLAAARY
jgi:hypothetical protein